MAKKSTADEQSFEDLITEAEELAEKMEEGGLSLDDSIRAYEKGVENLRKCAELLKVAEEKVKTLLEKNGAFQLDDLDGGDLDDEGEDE